MCSSQPEDTNSDLRPLSNMSTSQNRIEDGVNQPAAPIHPTAQLIKNYNQKHMVDLTEIPINPDDEKCYRKMPKYMAKYRHSDVNVMCGNCIDHALNLQRKLREALSSPESCSCLAHIGLGHKWTSDQVLLSEADQKLVGIYFRFQNTCYAYPGKSEPAIPGWPRFCPPSYCKLSL